MAKISELTNTNEALYSDFLVLSSAANGTRTITTSKFMETASKHNKRTVANAVTSTMATVNIATGYVTNNICTLYAELKTTQQVSAWASFITIDPAILPFGIRVIGMLDTAGNTYPLYVRPTGVCSPLKAIPQDVSLYVSVNYMM